MHSGSLKGKRTALIAFLPSESTADNEKYVKTAAEKGNQMRSKGSDEVVRRIDTTGVKKDRNGLRQQEESIWTETMGISCGGVVWSTRAAML